MKAVEDARIGLQQVYDALILGKERVVDRFLRQYKTSAFTERITASGETALMVAIKGGHGHIIKKLVSLTPPELLAFKEDFGNTALHVVAELDNVKTAQLLVNKNHELLNICNRREILPIHLAAMRGHREMTSYLFSVGMKDEIHSSLLKDADGEKLMFDLVAARFCDLALQLFYHNPELKMATDPITEVVVTENQTVAQVPSFAATQTVAPTGHAIVPVNHGEKHEKFNRLNFKRWQ
ncbi:Ankyrin repeat family protein [Abeliophyllum distichum]|uniref:Ankyrin repeat family protein n=1 Tax=Abeliophyllum distichum TaxID=126358 RepID=A0ABD1V7A5_9LAMI